MSMTTKKKSPWAILLIIVFSMISSALCQFKVPPIMSELITNLNLTGETQAGLLMSIFSFSGIVLSIPVGFIITRYGIYKTGAISLICSLLGSLLGIVANSYAILMASRIIEGIGLIFVATLGPAAIGSVFSEQKRGLAMGIMMSYMSVGQFIMFNVAPRISVGGSWKNVWWLTGVYSVIMLVIWLFGMRGIDAAISPDADPSDKKKQTTQAKDALFVVIKNPSVWLIGLTFALMLTTNQGVLAFLSRYLSEVRGMDPGKAGSITSLASIIGVLAGLLVGSISDKVNSRKGPMIVIFAISAVVYCIMPHFPTNTYFIMSLLYGLVTMGLATLCFAAIPDVIDNPEHNSMAVGVVNTLEKLGVFASSLLFGFLIETLGWNSSFYVMAPICVIGILSVVINKKMK